MNGSLLQYGELFTFVFKLGIVLVIDELKFF